MTETTLPHDDIDPDGLLEYSVVFTDRSLNHMSARFVSVMQEINRILRTAYDADAAAIVPGGGTYAMESVARQIATGKKCLILRNGLFSYRWSQILDAGSIADETVVLPAVPDSDDAQAAWSPAPIAEVVSAIERERPAVVFAPHVETASGMLLPDEYIRAVAEAVHAVGGVFVLDCIASGAVWVSMRDLGVDVLISAPQKGWSGSPCAGYVMLSKGGRAAVDVGTSPRFALALKKWLFIADEYEAGRAPYHATMPTDALAHNAALMRETEERGFDKLEAAQFELGERVRAVLAARELPSVAAAGYQAPSVVVVHTRNPQLANGAAFKEVGVQVAAGVPLHTGEQEGFTTFRIGLFGLDKLGDIDGTVARLEKALDEVDVV